MLSFSNLRETKKDTILSKQLQLEEQKKLEFYTWMSFRSQMLQMHLY